MKKVRSYVEFHVGEKLINEIEAYSNKNGLAENDYLFPTYKSPYMSTKSFWATFNAIIAEAGLDAGKENDGYSVHDMRRTCATEMYYKTSLKAASMRLGHKNIAMTEHYLRIKDTEENTAAIDRAVASLL
jgi:integrase